MLVPHHANLVCKLCPSFVQVSANLSFLEDKPFDFELSNDGFTPGLTSGIMG